MYHRQQRSQGTGLVGRVKTSLVCLIILVLVWGAVGQGIKPPSLVDRIFDRQYAAGCCMFQWSHRVTRDSKLAFFRKAAFFLYYCCSLPSWVGFLDVLVVIWLSFVSWLWLRGKLAFLFKLAFVRNIWLSFVRWPFVRSILCRYTQGVLRTVSILY